VEETWKTFPLDDRFLISDQGRVRGLRKMLKLQRDHDGYEVFIAWFRKEQAALEGKTCKLHKVHRAVMQTFGGEIPDGMHINHLNGIRHDNRLENLEVCSPAENTRHSFAALGRKGQNTNPTKGEKHHNSKLTTDQVLEIRRLAALGTPQISLALQFNTPQAHISRIVLKKAWRHV